MTVGTIVLLISSQLGAFSAKTATRTKNTTNNLGQAKDTVEHHSVSQLSYIREFQLSNNTTYNGIPVGGFSGIDHNPKTDEWILISDDSSDLAPARYYTVKLDFSTHTSNPIKFVNVITLKQPDGTRYPSSKEFEVNKVGSVPDFESIRFDPLNDNIWYTSEGDRKLGIMPFIRQARLDGSYLSEFKVPTQFQIETNPDTGFRHNLTLEGSTFSPDGKFYFTSMEGPLIQDGTVSSSSKGSFTRIIKYDRDGNNIAMYAYPLSKIPVKPNLGKKAEIGVSEILAINNHELLVLERSGVETDEASYKNYIRIYKIDMSKASNVNRLHSLQSGDFKPVSKELILDLNTLNSIPKLDNLEGMAWGPKFKNGNDTLVLVSDNNYNSSEITQFLLFEVK